MTYAMNLTDIECALDKFREIREYLENCDLEHYRLSSFYQKKLNLIESSLSDAIYAADSAVSNLYAQSENNKKEQLNN